MDKIELENPTQFDAYIEDLSADGTTEASPFDKGYWMAWMCSVDDKGKYIYDHRRAIEYFQSKYNRVVKQIAWHNRTKLPDVEVLDIPIPVGQIWVR